jgi:hypothetical protein
MTGFGFEAGRIVTGRPANYQVELLRNGYASVLHRASGLVTLIDPSNGGVRSGYSAPPEIIAEIRQRWGGAR